MRFESSVTAVSWIPSEMIRGLAALPFSMGVAHYDDPPPPRLEGSSIPAALERLRARDGFRIAHHLAAWVDADHGELSGFGQYGGGVLGSTSVRFGGSRTVRATGFAELRPDPEVGEGWVRFRQSAGGRTGLPMPRRVHRPPFVKLAAPSAWTTLELTIHLDGRSECALVGASPFPRHWVYDNSGVLMAKSGLVDFRRWYRHAFGSHSPWGDEDMVPVVADPESGLERELSGLVMDGAERPRILRLRAGGALMEQGEAGGELAVLLDGVATVVVDGRRLVDLGPGAIVGERASLESGRRTATLRAVTDCVVAAVDESCVTTEWLEELRRMHRRQ